MFESGDSVALPLIQLGKATLSGASGQRISLEYTSAQVLIEGDHLAELLGHLLDGRVRTIRRGRHGDCSIKIVQIVEV